MSFGRGAQVAGLAGGLVGGLVGGVVLFAAAYGYLLSLGAVVGAPSTGGGLALFVPLGAALGLLFGAALAALYVNRRALADTAPAAGLGYGIVLAVVLGVFGLPQLVTAQTQYAMAVPKLNGAVLLAWVAYGGVLGLVTRVAFLQLPVPERRHVPGTTETGGAVGGEEARAAVAGSLAGGLVGGVALYVLAGPLFLRYVGSVTGLGGTVGRGFVAWLLWALVLGAGFALVAGRTTTAYANSVIALTSRNETLRHLVLPSVRRAPMTTTAANMGLAYGVAAGIVVGVLALPALVTATTNFEFVGAWHPLAVVAAFAVYGVALGAGYGASLEGALPSLRPSFEGHLGAAVAGGLVGGAVGAGLLYAVAPAHLRLLGAIVGSPSTGAGLGAFLVLAVLLGLVFSGTVARGVGRTAGYASALTAAGLGYGIAVAALVGAVAVPVLAGAVTGFQPSVPLAAPSVLLAYVVYGVALGATYGGARGRIGGTLSPRASAILGGAVAGAVVGGAVLDVAAEAHLMFAAMAFGLGPNQAYGLGVFVVLGLLFGVGFGAVAGGYIDERSPRLATAVVGLWFGLALGVGVGLFGVNALAAATSGADIPVPAGQFTPILAAYILYGIAVSLGYRAVYRRAVGAPAPTGTGRGRVSWRATGFGAVLGGFLGGLVVHYAAGPPLHMRFVGAPFGLGGSVAQGWVAWTLLALVLGVVFALAVAGSLEEHAAALADASADSANLRMLLGPGLDRAPRTTTATLAGAAYGVAAAVVVAALLVPLLVNTLSTASLPMPSVRPAVWLGYVVYGAGLGFGYGAVVES